MNYRMNGLVKEIVRAEISHPGVGSTACNLADMGEWGGRGNNTFITSRVQQSIFGNIMHSKVVT